MTTIRAGFSSRLFITLTFGLLAIFIALLCMSPLHENDTFMYLAIIKNFFSSSHWPKNEPFTFTLTGTPWHTMHEWASYFIFYFLHKVGGWSAIIIFKTVVVFMTLSLGLTLAWKQKFESWLPITLVFLATVAASPLFIERTHLFNLFFLTLVLFIVLRDRSEPGRLKYFLPIIFLIWVNTHPSFLMGLLICFFRILIDFKKRSNPQYRLFLLCTIGAFIACFIHPEGWRGFFYPIDFAIHEAANLKSQTMEWLPPWDDRLGRFFEIKIFYLLIIISYLILILSRKKNPLFEAITLVFLTCLGMTAIRFMAPVSACLALLDIELAAKIDLFSFRKSSQFQKRVNFFAAGTLIVVLVLANFALINGTYPSVGPAKEMGLGIDKRFFPEGSLKFIEELNTTTNVFNGHGLGCFLAWKWSGERKIFYHGFINNESFYQKYYAGAIRSHEDFYKIMNEFNIGIILLGKFNGYTVLNHKLHDTSEFPDWHLAFEDEASYVYVRDDLIKKISPSLK